MTASFETPLCSYCGASVDEALDTSVTDRKPCAICASVARTFSVSIHESVTIRKKLSMKQKREGYKRPIFESVSGDDLHRKSGRWNKLTQIVDRENNHYRKVVVDPHTGEIIRFCDEPLTEHRNRGSAKMKKQP